MLLGQFVGAAKDLMRQFLSVLKNRVGIRILKLLRCPSIVIVIQP